MTLRGGRACEFKVFVTPFCSTTIEDKILIVAKRSGIKEASNNPQGLKAETTAMTLLCDDDVVGVKLSLRGATISTGPSSAETTSRSRRRREGA